MFRYAIQFGGMMGVATFAVFLLLYFMGFNPLGNASWLGAWIPVAVICVATKTYRENELEGFISYGTGYRVGLLTAAAGGLLSALLTFLFCSLYDSTIIDDFKNQTMSQMEMVENQMKSVFGNSVYQTAVESYEKINLQTIVSSEFFNKTFAGIIISLITAAIYKRDKPFTPTPSE